MNIEQVARELIKMAREGKNKEAKEMLYANDIISIEGNGDKLQGIDAIYRKSAEWGAQVAEVHSFSVSDPIVAANHFAVHFKMDISYQDGNRAVMDEIAVFEVRDGKIAFEQFFFKP